MTDSSTQITRNRIIMAIVALVIIVIAFFAFFQANEHRIEDQNADYLAGSTQQTVRRVDDLLTNASTNIAAVATVYQDSLSSPHFNPNDLNDLVDRTLFDYMLFVSPDGTCYDSFGREGNASEQEYFKEGMRGESGVCSVFGSVFPDGDSEENSNSLAFYSPLYYGDTQIGVLVGAYSESTLTDVLTTYFFGEQTTTYLCDQQGNILARSSVFSTRVEDIFELYAEGSNDITKEQLKEAFADGHSVSFMYDSSQQGSGSVYLMKLPSFDWVILRTFPASITDHMVANATQAGVLLLAGIVIAFLIFIISLLVTSRRQRQQLLLEKHQSDRIVDASLNLFKRFVVVDLTKNTYVYVKNKSVSKGLEPEGKFSDLKAYWTDRACDESSVAAIAEIYSKENLELELQTGIPFVQAEYRVENDEGGQEWIQSSVLCLDRDDEGRPTAVLFAAQDVTEIKQREQTIREALEEAYQAADQASRAKSDFLNSMSHDIRTPMNSIMGLTAIASMHIEDTERVKDCLSKITMASRHLLGLINEVLDMAKIESGNIGLSEEDFDLSESVESLLSIITPQVNAKHQNLKVDIADIEHEHVVGDPMRLQQVFVNIMGNSIKFTPEGGTVALHIRELPSRLPETACYEFTFSDTGCGMSEEFVKRVFEPFSRANDSRVTKVEGTGLGMSIVKNVVSLMNGTIDVKSKLGEGTQFTVIVQLKLQDRHHEDVEDLADLRVLVADDELTSCESAVDMLGSLGMDAEYVLSGDEACEKVKTAHEEGRDYNVIILDWKMPGKSGLEAARIIRSIVPEGLPIIILSAYDWSAIEQEARQVGIDAFISKPLFRSRLISTLTDLLSDYIEEETTSDSKSLELCAYQGYRILLTEDNELAAAIAQDILGMTGAEIEHAENGKRALDMLVEHDPGYYDMVFMDIQMPIMNGYEASRAIRTAAQDGRPDLADIPIVALTADAFTEDMQKAKDAGMNDHMSKPLEIPVLIKMLHEWMPKHPE